MPQILPYILPLLLGRTFNLDTMEVGVDIFPKEVITNPTIIESYSTQTKYKIVDNSVESRNLLDVEGSFSLKVKGGFFKAGASAAYLTDKYNRENTVEVAVKATYQMKTEQIPLDAKPIDSWDTLGSALGTHFVQSITYGGELIAAVRMECNNTRDKQRIAGSLEVGGRIKIFDVGVEVEGEYMKDVAKSIESTQIKLFSSIPLSKAPNDMKALKEVMDEFPEDLKNFNDGKGIPIKMELWPLNLLKSSLPSRLKNRVLEANLDGFEQKFDDLLNTKTAIADWMKVMTQPLSKENEQKVGNLYKEVNQKIRHFYEVIGVLDMSKGTDQLKPANDAYGLSIPGVYYKKYLQLRQSLVKDQGQWSLSRGNGATYTHWGKNKCADTAETMSKGTVVGSHGYGGGENFLCLPEKSDFGTPLTSNKDAAVVEDISYKFPNSNSYQVSCSTCRLGARGTVQVFVGRTDCPLEWDVVYDGILMSGSEDTVSTKFVCLDKSAQKSVKVEDKNPLVPDWALILDDNDAEDKHMLFTCVVCAK